MDKQCLRPEFTYQLLGSLVQAKSIRLISPHGQGRRRTLQDLRRLFPESWDVLQLDMRGIENTELACVNELSKQAKIENISTIHDLFHKMDKTSIYFLVIVHNFDLLTDINVISCLNSIEKYPYISLLCVSDKIQQKTALFAKDCMLPAITSRQLLNEITRRDWQFTKEEMHMCVEFLLQQSSPYSLLDEQPLSWFRHRFCTTKNTC